MLHPTKQRPYLRDKNYNISVNIFLLSLEPTVNRTLRITKAFCSAPLYKVERGFFESSYPVSRHSSWATVLVVAYQTKKTLLMKGLKLSVIGSYQILNKLCDIRVGLNKGLIIRILLDSLLQVS